MGRGDARPGGPPPSGPLEVANVQEIDVNIWDDSQAAIRNVREGRATFALVVLDPAFEREQLRVNPGKRKENPKYERDGVIAEQLPYVEPEVGLIYHKHDENRLFPEHDDGSRERDIATILGNTTLILPGRDPLSDLLRQLSVGQAKARLLQKTDAGVVIIRSPTYRHLKNLVRGRAGIGICEQPLGEEEDQDLRFKPFTDLSMTEDARATVNSIKANRYAMYYRKDLDQPGGRGHALKLAQAMMDCIRAICRGELDDVYEPISPSVSASEADGRTPILTHKNCPLVFRMGPKAERLLVSRLCM